MIWCCSFQYQPQQYASALLSLERERTSSVTLGIAAGGHGQKQLAGAGAAHRGIKINRHKLPQAGAWLAVVMLLGFIAMVNPVKIVEEKSIPHCRNLPLPRAIKPGSPPMNNPLPSSISVPLRRKKC